MTETLTVGGITLTIDGIDLRDIRWHGNEAVRRIYPVFQDRNWTNRLFVITARDIREDDGAVLMIAEGTGSFDAAPLRWSVQARISDSTIDYRFSADTHEPFWRNRLGMCVLHPMSAAGSRCEIEHVDGSLESARLPTDIAPFQPFIDMRAITHELPSGSHARVRLFGETFEMEDHRNWTDASFKTYCTPITDPFPVQVSPGDTIEQGVEVTFPPVGQSTPPAINDDLITVIVDENSQALPRFGVSLSAEDDYRIEDSAVDAFASLELDHLRIPISATDPNVHDALRNAATSARRIGSRLRVAAVCAQPQELRTWADLDPQIIGAIDCLYVFSETHKVTPDNWADEARAALGPAWSEVLLGGGTDLYFTELNREPPDPGAFSVLNFSVNPQVHAFDDRTLIQNAMTQQVVAHNAARLSESTPISVGPISLRPRFNPNATDPGSDVSNTSLPSDVDARQCTNFAANWTAMSIKYLTAAGTIDYATYFEAVGWKGIRERSTGSADPTNFPSSAGAPFPVWEVFAALAGMTHARNCSSTSPEEVDVIIVENSQRRRALIANWCDRTRDVQIADSAPIPAAPQTLTIVDITTI